LFFAKYWETYHINHIAGIITGSVIIALAIQTIIVPLHLLTGGLTGVAMIVHYLTGANIWVLYAVMNIPVFIAGYRFVGRRFILYSLGGTLALTALLYIVPYIDWNNYINIQDPLLAAIAGGAANGLGAGLIFRCQGSTGGIDIIAVIMKYKRDYSIGQTSFIFNIIIILIMLSFSNLTLALYSSISIFISAKVIDIVINGGRACRTVMIISRRNQDIAEAILNNLKRGCTILSVRGGYSREKHEMIMITVGKTQLPLLKEIIFFIDNQAFIIINESTEVFGRGFRSSDIRDFQVFNK
jgi:uncharacterized membrane-anchored protein YitT (DUF2179 family)